MKTGDKFTTKHNTTFTIIEEYKGNFVCRCSCNMVSILTKDQILNSDSSCQYCCSLSKNIVIDTNTPKPNWLISWRKRRNGIEEEKKRIDIWAENDKKLHPERWDHKLREPYKGGYFPPTLEDLKQLNTTQHKTSCSEITQTVPNECHLGRDIKPEQHNKCLIAFHSGNDTNRSSGYVYILTNRSMPNHIKIGKTTKLPEVRSQELSTSTGIPIPFQVYYAVHVMNCTALETDMHNKFRTCRENLGREFFQLSPEEAKSALDELSKKYT